MSDAPDRPPAGGSTADPAVGRGWRRPRGPFLPLVLIGTLLVGMMLGGLAVTAGLVVGHVIGHHRVDHHRYDDGRFDHHRNRPGWSDRQNRPPSPTPS